MAHHCRFSIALVVSLIGGVAHAAADGPFSEMRFSSLDGGHVTLRASAPRVTATGAVEVQTFVGLHGLAVDGTYNHFFKGTIVASSADEAVGYIGYTTQVASGAMTLAAANQRTGGAITLEAGRLPALAPVLAEQEKLGEMAVSFVGMAGTQRAQDIARAALASSEAPVCGAVQSCAQDLIVETTPVLSAVGGWYQVELGGWVRSSDGAGIAGAHVALTGLLSLCGNGGCTANCLVGAPTITTLWGVTDDQGVATLLLSDGLPFDAQFFCLTGYSVLVPGAVESCDVNSSVLPWLPPTYEDVVPIETPLP